MRDHQNVKYLSPAQRLLAAFLSAYFIIIEGQPGPFYRTVQSYDFLITLVFSFVIALILIETVHMGSKLLDRFRPWKSHAFQRLLLQLLFGVAMVVWLDILLVKGFFRLFSYDFEKSGYMVSEFPLVKLMIYILNIYYWTCHVAPGLFNLGRLFSRKRPLVENDFTGGDATVQDTTASAVVLLKLGSKIKYVAAGEVCCFKRESAVGYAYLKDGSVWNFDYTTADLLGLLPEGEFFQTSRGIVYALDIIEGQRREKKEGLLVLREGYSLDVSRTVSRDRYADFRKALSDYAQKKVTKPS